MMGIRTLHKLSAKKVLTIREPGAYEDGGGLRLVVESSLSKHWVLRITIKGKRVARGLGGFPAVSLEGAREKAAEARQEAKEGRDVLGAAHTARKASSPYTTLREAFELFYETKKRGLRNKKHAAQWESTLETYVFAALGDKPVESITGHDLINCLGALWSDKHETATRILQRLKATIESHAVHTNSRHTLPWVGIRNELNGSIRQIDRIVKHHRSMPWREVPAFFKLLSKGDRISRFSLRWVILTACRSSEASGARWPEIDQEKKLWTIPAARMKATKDHVVPLSQQCLDLLSQLEDLAICDKFLFPAPKGGGEMSENAMLNLIDDMGFKTVTTTHGFRSSFKGWASATGVDDRVSEVALAHADPNRVRAAYLRTDFLDERRKVMADWGAFLLG